MGSDRMEAIAAALSAPVLRCAYRYAYGRVCGLPRTAHKWHDLRHMQKHEYEPEVFDHAFTVEKGESIHE